MLVPPSCKSCAGVARLLYTLMKLDQTPRRPNRHPGQANQRRILWFMSWLSRAEVPCSARREFGWQACFVTCGYWVEAAVCPRSLPGIPDPALPQIFLAAFMLVLRI